MAYRKREFTASRGMNPDGGCARSEQITKAIVESHIAKEGVNGSVA